MAKDDAVDADLNPPLHSVGPSAFVYQGLRIEEQQYVTFRNLY